MDKYEKVISINDLNPMSTAPLYGYYDWDVETVIIFYKDYEFDGDNIHNARGYFDNRRGLWVNWHTEDPIIDDLIGWLPDFVVVE